jgi:hypothetical protein
MLRQVLSASASIALLAGLTACGEDQAGSAPSPSPSDAGTVSASPTDSPSPTDAPPVEYKQSPGQADKVKAALTGASFTCSELSDQYYGYTVCSKADRYDLTWIKYVAAKDGTVVFAKVSDFDDLKPALTAIVGATDAAVLLAQGSTIKWGYGGPDWVSIKGMNSAPEPPQAKPFENTRAELLAVLQPDPTLHCTIEDTEPSAPPSQPGEIIPSESASPALQSRLSCQPAKISQKEDVRISAYFTDDKLTELHIYGGYDFTGERASFEPARTALKNITDKLFPALEGGDTQAIQTWVDAHAKPGGGAITYLDGRRIIQRVYSPPESDKALIQVFIANEKVGLDEEEG